MRTRLSDATCLLILECDGVPLRSWEGGRASWRWMNRLVVAGRCCTFSFAFVNRVSGKKKPIFQGFLVRRHRFVNRVSENRPFSKALATGCVAFRFCQQQKFRRWTIVAVSPTTFVLVSINETDAPQNAHSPQQSRFWSGQQESCRAQRFWRLSANQFRFGTTVTVHPGATMFFFVSINETGAPQTSISPTTNALGLCQQTTPFRVFQQNKVSVLDATPTMMFFLVSINEVGARNAHISPFKELGRWSGAMETGGPPRCWGAFAFPCSLFVSVVVFVSVFVSGFRCRFRFQSRVRFRFRSRVRSRFRFRVRFRVRVRLHFRVRFRF